MTHKFQRGQGKIRLDNAGRDSQNTVFGEHIVAQRVPRINVKFNYNLATDDVTTTTANNGTVTHSGDIAVISSSTTSNGSAQIESVDTVEYVTGQEGFAFFTASFVNGGVANSLQHVGLFDDDDGYYLGFGGTGVDGTDAIIGYKKGGTQTNIKQNNWNVDHLDGTGPSDLTVDFTQMNVFKISFGWLGVAPVTWEIMGPDGTFHTFHKRDQTGETTGPHSSNPTFPVCMRVTKTSGSEDIIIHTASWNAGTVGLPAESAFRYFPAHQDATVTTEAVVLNIENQSTFQSKTNRVTTELVYLDIATDGTKTAEISVYKNLSISGASWSNVDATNSVSRTDTAGTVTPAAANLELEFALAKVDSKTVDLRGYGLVLHPGETWTITASSASSSDVHCSVRCRELF